MTEDQLRAKLKDMIALAEKTAKIVKTDENQEPIDPEMLGFWKSCLTNQYSLQLLLNHLNS